MALPEGLLVLRHDGRAWELWQQVGPTEHRTDAIPAEDMPSACRWARDVVVSDVDWTPDDMGDEAAYYVIQHRTELGLCAEPVGGLHHDGTGWVRVDSLGHITHRNDAIGRDDTAAAYEWVEPINAGIFGPAPTAAGRTINGRYG